MVPNNKEGRALDRVYRRRFLQAAGVGGALLGASGSAVGQAAGFEAVGGGGQETGADEAEAESRIGSIRDFSNENYELLYTYRKHPRVVLPGRRAGVRR